MRKLVGIHSDIYNPKNYLIELESGDEVEFLGVEKAREVFARELVSCDDPSKLGAVEALFKQEGEEK